MSGDKRLRELLNYSTSLSEQRHGEDDTAPISPPRSIDASLLDQFMGPDDAKLMLQSMSAIQDSSLPVSQHEIAFENLEALVEQIDNAKNLQNLKLWPPLLAQLGRDDHIYRQGACAVIATAVQNNPVSQADFLKLDGLRMVLHLFETDPVQSVRKKALFAVTSTIRNNSLALTAFGELQGWKVFSDYLDAVQDNQMQKRIIFFLGTLYSHVEVEEGAEKVMEGSDGKHTSDEIKTGFPPKLVKLLEHGQVQGDEDLTEKILYTLLMSLQMDSEVLNRELKNRLKDLAGKMRTLYGQDICQFDILFNLLQ